MNPVILHPLIYWLLISFSFIFMGAMIFFGWQWIKVYFSDVMLFIDKSDRFQLIYTNLKNKKKYIHLGSAYPLVDKSSILNKRGKALFIFSEDNPNAAKLTHNKTEWLDAGSLRSVINNELIKKLVKPTTPIFDFMIIFGAIGGIVAGLAATIHLLIATGVLGG